MFRLSVRHLVYLVCFVLLALLQGRPVEGARQPIQSQGSSPYCLFAVNAYLAGGDMWRLEAEYHRRRLATWDGVTPKNDQVLALASELYGARWTIWKQGDWWSARWGVQQGHATAFTGRGHAIIVVAFEGGQAFYIDSLQPDGVKSMSEESLRQWWDGWAWFNNR